jgi:ADP-ribosyl-[dinitrogen reductase] hydrolase
MELQRIGENLLPSVAYGDAAGVPVETKSFTYITEKHGKLTRLIPTTDNFYFKGEWPVGKTSDDTQLSVAVTNALIKANGFDLRRIADEHIDAYHDTPEYTLQDGRVKKIGWGGSTTSSIQRIIDGASPQESGFKGGDGNGILMKMAPLVYWQYARFMSDKQRYQQYDQLTTMTHDSDVARVSTRVHGDVLYDILLDNYNYKTLGNRAYYLAMYHEKQLGGSTNDVSSNLNFLRGHNIESIPEIEGIYARKNPGLDDREFGKSYGFYVPETLAISYAAFRLGRGDYRRTVYTAVNLGGDADSTASITGAMVNFARKGEQDMPDDIDKVQDIDKLRELSRELAARALT